MRRHVTRRRRRKPNRSTSRRKIRGCTRLMLFAPLLLGLAVHGTTPSRALGDMSIREAQTFEFMHFAGAAVLALAFTPDSRFLASGLDDGRVLLLDVEEETVHRELPTHSGPVTSVAVSPDGRWLASSGEDGWVHVTDLTDQEVSFSLSHDGIVYEAEFSPKGTYLATAGESRLVRMWVVATWAERTAFAGHTGTVFALGISPAEDLMIIGAGEPDYPSIRLWDLNTGEELVNDLYEGRVHDIEYSPRARDRHATISSTQRIMTLWDVDREAYLHIIAPYAGAINDADYSSLGNTLVAVCDDGTFFFTTMPHWTAKRTIQFDAPLLAVSFADSRHYIACSDDAGNVYLVFVPS